MLAEEDHSGGTQETDEAESLLDDISSHIDERIKFCNGNYPFELDNNGYTLRRKDATSSADLIYCFLLLATRLNMKDQRTQDGLDGTQIFEELSEMVLSNYLGNRSKSLLFGTAARNSGGFRGKVTQLIQLINEGIEYQEHSNTDGSFQNDGGLDVVGWIPFADQHGGQLIGFGQCKTGTHWKHELSKTQPDNFIRLWFREAPLVLPVRFFFIAEGEPRDRWAEHCIKGGILMDRFRIMDYLPELEQAFVNKIRRWVAAAIQTAAS